MNKKLQMRVFDNKAKNFVELGCFPNAKQDEAVLRAVIFQEDRDPTILSIYSIPDNSKERECSSFDDTEFSFSRFTGKYDIADKPIFEDDFVQIGKDRFGVVFYDDDDAAFEVRFKDGIKLSFLALKDESILVTGNRFEVPEVQVRD